MKPKKLERGLIDSDRIGALIPSEKSFAAPLYDEYKDYGWIQCTQCGNGFQVHKSEVDAGDYVDRQVCDHCGIGPMLIDWTWPDGEGWKNND